MVKFPKPVDPKVIQPGPIGLIEMWDYKTRTSNLSDWCQFKKTQYELLKDYLPTIRDIHHKTKAIKKVIAHMYCYQCYFNFVEYRQIYNNKLRYLCTNCYTKIC